MSVLACDLGGTRIKLGVVRGGELLAVDSIEAHSAGTLRDALPRVEATLRDLCSQVGVEPQDCAGLGIGFPSLVDHLAGRIVAHHGKFADGLGFDLQGWSARAWNLPVALENDARLACIGEWQCGAGRGASNLAMITLGTGVGTAVIMEGRVLRGKSGQSGNLGGHFTVDISGAQCPCGNRGCVETIASTASLPQQAQTLAGFSASALSQVHPLDFRAVFTHARQGDACAQTLRDRALDAWGALCVNLIHAFGLDRIVLGGGIMASAEVILPALQTYVDAHATKPWGPVQLVAAEHPNNMALLGCEWLLQEQLERSS